MEKSILEFSVFVFVFVFVLLFVFIIVLFMVLLMIVLLFPPLPLFEVGLAGVPFGKFANVPFKFPPFPPLLVLLCFPE